MRVYITVFLRSIYEYAFGVSETTKAKSSKAADVNMDELVGNTDGFADSGYVVTRVSGIKTLPSPVASVPRLCNDIWIRFLKLPSLPLLQTKALPWMF